MTRSRMSLEEGLCISLVSLSIMVGFGLIVPEIAGSRLRVPSMMNTSGSVVTHDRAFHA